ncbi:hypothetical protein O0550_22290 [Brevibacillus halotolerans]|uniref:RCC1 domain-containing protein n=1 Tax=Brevibacillus TaxID=55080 RepID=UPI00215CFA85|nr:MULTISPECIES: hypothetical protein [Brevibacillus]MCR8965888.1 hypothetical protein [Brevibacillus laterosporus]MCZ0838044.1 hypothetical protein [Brevibacillus halotolerans]
MSLHSGSFTIKNDNTLWCYGGFVGNDSPVKIMNDVKYYNYSNYGISVAIKTDDSLWVQGYNNYGQLGIPNETYITLHKKIMDDIKHVSALEYHTMVIKKDNTLWGFGRNTHGELGHSTNLKTNNANATPTKIMDDVRYVSCGSDHTNVIKRDGTLWGFGNNSSGQLGNPRNDKGIPYPVKLFDDALFLAEQPPLQEKILLIDQDNILTFNRDKWVVAGKTPYSEQDFIQYGVEYLNVYMIEALKSFSNIDIACWVQDSTNDEDLNIVLCGDYTAPYRYKIEMLEPYVLLKEWTPILTGETHSTVPLNSDMFQQATNPYTIKITVEQPDGTVITEEGKILLYDTEPKLLVKLEGKNLKIEIGDNEQDKIKFKVNLNGKQIYPSEGFTDFLPTPHIQTIYLNTKDINIDSSNIIETIAFDSYGKESRDVTSFIGDYIGLIFSDEKGKYYSTDAGEVLQYLSFGSIIAGQTTPYQLKLT